jgi:hypothetical protein
MDETAGKLSFPWKALPTTTGRKVVKRQPLVERYLPTTFTVFISVCKEGSVTFNSSCALDFLFLFLLTYGDALFLEHFQGIWLL